MFIELSLLRRVVLCQPRHVALFDLGALLPVFGVRDVFRLVRREGRIGVEQLDDSIPSLADQVELFGAAQGGCRIAGRAEDLSQIRRSVGVFRGDLRKPLVAGTPCRLATSQSWSNIPRAKRVLPLPS